MIQGNTVMCAGTILAVLSVISAFMPVVPREWGEFLVGAGFVLSLLSLLVYVCGSRDRRLRWVLVLNLVLLTGFVGWFLYEGPAS